MANVETSFVDKFDIGDVGQMMISLFSILGVYTSPTLTPPNPIVGYLLLTVGLFAIYVANFGISYKQLERAFVTNLSDRAGRLALKHFIAGVLISVMWVVVIGLILEPQAFTSVSAFLTSVSVVALVVGLSTAAFIDTIRD